MLGQFALLFVLDKLLTVEAGHLSVTVLLLHHLDPRDPGHVDHPLQPTGDLHHLDPLLGEGGHPGRLEDAGEAVAEQGVSECGVHSLGGAADGHLSGQHVLDLVLEPAQQTDHLCVISAGHQVSLMLSVIPLPVYETVSAGLPAVGEHVQHTGDVAGVAELRPGPAVNVAILTLLLPELLQLGQHQAGDECHDQEQHRHSELVMVSCGDSLQV